jgi:hypothetical protein
MMQQASGAPLLSNQLRRVHVITEAEISQLSADLDILVRTLKTGSDLNEPTDAEIEGMLESLDTLDKIVVDDVDPSELARVRSQLADQLEQSLALAREVGDPIVTKLIQSALARFRN